MFELLFLSIFSSQGITGSGIKTVSEYSNDLRVAFNCVFKKRLLPPKFSLHASRFLADLNANPPSVLYSSFNLSSKSENAFIDFSAR